ncbi:hypothetical protein FQN60_011918, partial [Etheostoma spectabile]
VLKKRSLRVEREDITLQTEFKLSNQEPPTPPTMIGHTLTSQKKKQKDSLINLKIQKENPKVVNEIDIEDLNSANVCYCRCWRSKTFPVCDKSHLKHNELTGDNVGPLILKKKIL